jgi:hypothetical protein
LNLARKGESDRPRAIHHQGAEQPRADEHFGNFDGVDFDGQQDLPATDAVAMALLSKGG